MAQVSDNALLEAYVRGGLGAVEHYFVWTALWGVRSRIWQHDEFRKAARKSMGKIAFGAVEEGDPALFQHLADALSAMMEFEREPGNALKADVFFAIEELNSTRKRFDRRALMNWLNETLETPIEAGQLPKILEEMALADLIPD